MRATASSSSNVAMLAACTTPQTCRHNSCGRNSGRVASVRVALAGSRLRCPTVGCSASRKVLTVHAQSAEVAVETKEATKSPAVAELEVRRQAHSFGNRRLVSLAATGTKQTSKANAQHFAITTASDSRQNCAASCCFEL